MRRPEVERAFRAAVTALFSVEQALSPSSDDPARRAVYRLRAALSTEWERSREDNTCEAAPAAGERG